jgi:hypothetical protein
VNLDEIMAEAQAEAAGTRDLRIANIVAVIIRAASKGQAMNPEFYVPAIVDNVLTTALTPDERTWLVLQDEDELDEDEDEDEDE